MDESLRKDTSPEKNPHQEGGDFENAPQEFYEEMKKQGGYILSNLSNPTLLQMFPQPSDLQYTIMRNCFYSEQIYPHTVETLRQELKNPEKPLFAKIQLLKSVRVALQVSPDLVSQDSGLEQKVNKVREDMETISNDPETPYFLSVFSSPDIVLSPVSSFSRMEEGLTPVPVTQDTYVQDNKHDPIPIFYQALHKEGFDLLIQEQAKRFEQARPESRPEVPQNASFQELKEFKTKFIDGHIKIDERLQALRDKKEKLSRRLSPEEILSFFPESKTVFDLTQDPKLFEFRSFVMPEIRQKIGKDFNIDFNQIPLKEQVYFLTNIAHFKNKDIEKVIDFSSRYKENGLRTFLSIAHGGKEMGNKILTLAEKLPEDSVTILFQTYSDMVDSAEEVGVLLKNNLGDRATPDLVEQSKESLLIAGKNLLEKYSQQAHTCEGVECETLGEELKEKLSLAKKSVFAFSYVCKTLVENGQFSFEDFEKVTLWYEKSPLAEDIKNQIVEMHKENTKQYPENLRDVWRNTLKNGLENSDPHQLIVHVAYEKDIVSAMRVIEQADGSWYGASFNVNPTVQGSKVGSELLKKVLDDLAKDKPFVADCYSKNPMLETYVNKFGFVITKEIENYENTGELVYQITLSPKKQED